MERVKEEFKIRRLSAPLVDNPDLLVYKWSLGEQEWLVVANLSSQVRILDIGLPLPDHYRFVISHFDRRDLDKDLGAFEAFIVERSK